MIFIRHQLRRLALAALLLWPQAGTHGSGLDSPQPVGAFLNGAFPEVAPGAAGGWTTDNAFPNLTFVDPIWITPYPGSTDLVVAEKTGRIFRFPNNPSVTTAQRTMILDWTARVQTSEDQGFYSLVFHPEFGQPASSNRGFIYVCYSHKFNAGVSNPDNTYWRVTRFTISDGTTVIDPDSETILITQFDPHRWHQGGAMFFSVAGFLYISNGDGGGEFDPFNYSQRIDLGLFGGVLRIDVDMDLSRGHPIRRQPLDTNRPAGWPASYSQNYTIPSDNPFVQNPPPAPGQQAGVLEEFCAIGLRNPHSMHYDDETGQVWIGDVGQSSREEFNLFLIEPAASFTPGNGPNFQWAHMEGTQSTPIPPPGVILGNPTPPVHDYPRDEGKAIIGGFPYWGSQFASDLGGKVLFGDHVFGKILALTYPSLQIEELTGFTTGYKIGLANFFEDADEEVLIPNLNGTNQPGGTIRRLAKTDPGEAPPAWLSQTGAFTSLDTLEPAPFLIPFEVNSPLWSDGALKKRWIAVPNDGIHDTAAEKIVFSETDNWIFPEGTVLIKHFDLPLDENNPAITTRLETRFIICTVNGGKYGVTYRWLQDQSDAYLISARETADYSITAKDYSVATQTWPFPSRADCLRCHGEAAGQALGVRTHQLNGDAFYPATGRTDNQLRTWNALGMFTESLTETQIRNFLRSTSLTDENVPLEHRIRSYLDANCAHCHRPGGSGPSFDARLFTALQNQNVVNGQLDGYFDLGPNDALIKPRDIALSAIHARLSRARPDPFAMPPLAKNVVDQLAVARVEEWIQSLDPAEFGHASFVKLIADSEVDGGPHTSIAELNILDGSDTVIPQNTLSLVSVDSEELVLGDFSGARAIDGDPHTTWRTESNAPGDENDPPHPHAIVLDLGAQVTIGGFSYLPRTDPLDGRIEDWRFQISSDGTKWTELAAGNFDSSSELKTVSRLGSGARVRVLVGGPQEMVTGNFQIVIVFDADVSDFKASDLFVENGDVVELLGSRHFYTATIQPTGPQVSVILPPNAVTSPAGFGNLYSNMLSASVGVSYELWTAFHGLSGSAAGFFANDDGDGQVAFCEYLFNLNPRLPDQTIFDPQAAIGPMGPVGLPRITMIEGPGGEDHLRIEYLRRRSALLEGFAYVAQFTSELAQSPESSWTDRTDGIVTIIDAEWEWVRVDDVVSIDSTGQRFGRLKLIAPTAP